MTGTRLALGALALALIVGSLGSRPAAAGTITRIHDGSGGGFVVSDDGRWVLARVSTSRCLLLDRYSTRTRELSGCFEGRDMTPDGRFIVWPSFDDDLVPADTNGEADVFLLDRDGDGDGIFDEPDDDRVEMVSVATDGAPGTGESLFPTISGDGTRVAFTTNATNFGVTGGSGERIAVRDRVAGTTRIVSVDDMGNALGAGSVRPRIARDGQSATFVNFALGPVRFALATGSSDVLPFDPQLGAVFPTGTASAYVFVADDDPLGLGAVGQHAYAFDLAGGTMRRLALAAPSTDVGIGEGTDGGVDARESALSDDGRFFAFQGKGLGLVDTPDGFTCSTTSGTAAGNAKCNDVFVFDRDGDGNGILDEPNGTILVLASTSVTGERGDRGSDDPAVSPNGRFLAFASAANLDGVSAPGSFRVYLRDLTCANGRLELNETCDDGNLTDGDGCDANCETTGCGNWVVTAGEACDDGNRRDGDTCSSDCLVAVPEICLGFTGFEAARCQLSIDRSTPLCSGSGDTKVRRLYTDALARARARLEGAARGAPARQRRALRAVGRLLAKAQRQVARRRASAECRAAATALLQQVRAATGG